MIDIQVRTSYGSLNLSKQGGSSVRDKERSFTTTEPSPKTAEGLGYTSFVVAPLTLLAAQETREIDAIRRDDLQGDKQQGRRADDAEEEASAQNPRVLSDEPQTSEHAVFQDAVGSVERIADGGLGEGVVVELFPNAFSASSSASSKLPGTLFARANTAYRANGAIDGRTYYGGSAGADFTHVLDQGFNIVV